jgi:hypothetical protein
MSVTGGGNAGARVRPGLQTTDERARFPTIHAIGERLGFHEDLYHLALRMAMHRIDEASPFHGDGFARLKEQRTELFLSLTGLDETLMQTISARWRYSLDDIVIGHRFADVIVVREDGVRVIDYDQFHELVPCGEIAEKAG